MKKALSFETLGAVQVRIARATTSIQSILPFYTKGLGLSIIDYFNDHDGYSGVMLGLPDFQYHLEFTESLHIEQIQPPNADALLVFYIPHEAPLSDAVKRFEELGFFPVKSLNPYWDSIGLTYQDPDGWRIVLAKGKGI